MDVLYRISRVASPPEMEALAVAKIDHYPLEKADYKPFAQCCLCVTEEELALRMWAFEVNTAPHSELRGLFRFPELPGCSLHAVVRPPDIAVQGGPDNHMAVFLQNDDTGEVLRQLPFQGHSHNGEDLQGVYWGGDFRIPHAAWDGKLSFPEGMRFRGNFYKTRTDAPFVHCGSWAPAEFPDEPWSDSSMGEFQVVAY